MGVARGERGGVIAEIVAVKGTVERGAEGKRLAVIEREKIALVGDAQDKRGIPGVELEDSFGFDKLDGHSYLRLMEYMEIYGYCQLQKTDDGGSVEPRFV